MSADRAAGPQQKRAGQWPSRRYDEREAGADQGAGAGSPGAAAGTLEWVDWFNNGNIPSAEAEAAHYAQLEAIPMAA